MKQDTRTKNSARNLIFSFMGYLLQIILNFVIRRYFIYVFSVEYLGLNSLFSNVLSVLSLVELGFGTALVYSMYKPMAEDDKEKVKQLLQYYKNIYCVVGTIIGILGALVLFFMPYFQAKAPNISVDLYIVYLIFLVNTVVSYFFAYRRSLLYVSQRSDLESKINMVVNIFVSILTLVILLIFKNYYLYAVTSIIGTLITNLLIYVLTNKKYAEYVTKPEQKLDKLTKKEITKNVFALMFHRIGSVVVYGTDSFIIYLMIDSATLGIYSNYLLIINAVTAIINIFTNSVRSSIGNLIASENKEKTYNIFTNLNFIYFWMLSFCAICFFILSNPFIQYVFASGNKDYVLSQELALLISVNFYITTSRYLTGTFKDCAGLFYEDRFKPLVESIVNLVVSIVLTKYIGLAGVIIGTITSSLFVSVWVEPFVLFKHYFKINVLKYYIRYILYSCCMAITGLIAWFVCSFITVSGLVSLLFIFVVCILLTLGVLFIFALLFPEFKRSKNWLFNILKSFKKNKEIKGD